VERSEQIDQLIPALYSAWHEAVNPVKNAKNPHFGNKYADLEEVLAVIKPALKKNGLAVVQWPGGDDNGPELHQMVIHSSGQWLKLEPAYAAASKKDPQGFGSGLTYLRRYSLQALLGVAAEDDDGEGAVVRPPVKPAIKK
jgi:hypothetical protein